MTGTGAPVQVEIEATRRALRQLARAARRHGGLERVALAVKRRRARDQPGHGTRRRRRDRRGAARAWCRRCGRRDPGAGRVRRARRRAARIGCPSNGALRRARIASSTRSSRPARRASKRRPLAGHPIAAEEQRVKLFVVEPRAARRRDHPLDARQRLPGGTELPGGIDVVGAVLSRHPQKLARPAADVEPARLDPEPHRKPSAGERGRHRDDCSTPTGAGECSYASASARAGAGAYVAS